MSVNAPRPEAIDIEIRQGHRRPARAIDLSANVAGTVAASRLVIASEVHILLGYAIREPTNAAGANFRLHDGTTTGNQLLVNANLTTNESVRDWFGPGGIEVTTGAIYLEVLTGSVEGVLYWR